MTDSRFPPRTAWRRADPAASPRLLCKPRCPVVRLRPHMAPDIPPAFHPRWLLAYDASTSPRPRRVAAGVHRGLRPITGLMGSRSRPHDLLHHPWSERSSSPSGRCATRASRCLCSILLTTTTLRGEWGSSWFRDDPAEDGYHLPPRAHRAKITPHARYLICSPTPPRTSTPCLIELLSSMRDRKFLIADEV